MPIIRLAGLSINPRNRSENVRVARRAVVIDEICKRLGAVAFIKGPLNELHEIATKVKELK